MKKFVSILSCVLLVCLVLTAFAACANNDKPDSLVIYNWADYIFDEKFDDEMHDFVQYYKQVTGRTIKVTYTTFDTNETMLTRLTQGDSSVDVVCPSEYAIQKLYEMDMLVELNYFDQDKYTQGFSDYTKSNYVHNSDNVEPLIREKVEDAFGDMINYFVPYMYGTLGILYNKKEFKKLGIYDVDHPEIMNDANWGILFNDNGSGEILSDKLTGKILMKDSIRDSYAATIFYLQQTGKLDDLTNDKGESYATMPASRLINAVDDTLLDVVRDTLVKQKSQLFGYEVDFGKDDLLQENAFVDLAWSGDALYAVEESWDKNLINDDGEKGDYKLGYYVPHGAGNIWFDGWVVPKTYNPDHIEAIKIFINYLNTPRVAAANLLEIGYTAAVSPDVLQADPDAMSVLMEDYDYDPASPDDVIDFTAEFFDYVDSIDGSNWRYPFVTAPLERDPTNPYDRSVDTLGVMRDFGDNNKKVVTMWNYARSVGSEKEALLLLAWTALAVAVAVGVLFAVIGIKRWRSHTIKMPKAALQSE